MPRSTFQTLCRQLNDLLRIINHTQAISPNHLDNQAPPAFIRKVKELSEFMKPAKPSQNTKSKLLQESINWAENSMRVLREHYTNLVISLNRETKELIKRETITTTDIERAEKIAIAWAGKRLNKKLRPASIIILKGFIKKMKQEGLETPKPREEERTLTTPPREKTMPPTTSTPREGRGSHHTRPTTAGPTRGDPNPPPRPPTRLITTPSDHRRPQALRTPPGEYRNPNPTRKSPPTTTRMSTPTRATNKGTPLRPTTTPPRDLPRPGHTQGPIAPPRDHTEWPALPTPPRDSHNPASYPPTQWPTPTPPQGSPRHNDGPLYIPPHRRSPLIPTTPQHRQNRPTGGQQTRQGKGPLSVDTPSPRHLRSGRRIPSTTLTPGVGRKIHSHKARSHQEKTTQWRVEALSNPHTLILGTSNLARITSNPPPGHGTTCIPRGQIHPPTQRTGQEQGGPQP